AGARTTALDSGRHHSGLCAGIVRPDHDAPARATTAAAALGIGRSAGGPGGRKEPARAAPAGIAGIHAGSGGTVTAVGDHTRCRTELDGVSLEEDRAAAAAPALRRPVTAGSQDLSVDQEAAARGDLNGSAACTAAHLGA